MSLSSRCTRRGRWPSLRGRADLEHAVEVARGAGAALHRKPHRLVEHQHVVVLVERDRFEEGAVLRRLGASSRGFGGSTLSGGMRTPGPPRSRSFGCGALAVHPHLAFADDALDVAERQAGKPRLEETVDPHAVLVAADVDGLHALAGLVADLWAWSRCRLRSSPFRGGSSVPATLGGLALRRPRPANGYAATRGKETSKSPSPGWCQARRSPPPAPPQTAPHDAGAEVAELVRRAGEQAVDRADPAAHLRRGPKLWR